MPRLNGPSLLTFLEQNPDGDRDALALDAGYFVMRNGKPSVQRCEFLQAIADAQPVLEPNLSFAVQEFDLPVENTLFQIAFQSGMFDRSLSNYAEGETLDPYKIPLVTTEISALDVGRCSKDGW